jgi:hypothetical protein
VPSRKQRRRRLKERRHEYEYVYVDEEGREVEAPEDEQPPASPRGKSPSGGRRAAPSTRAGRRIEPASWSRVGKRGLFFAPVMFLLIGLLGKNVSIAQRVYETVVLLAIFLPFSYFMDSMMYRSYLKRTGGTPPPTRRRGSNGAA